MEQSKKVPVLRFPEFSGKWEEKRLDSVSKIGRGKSKHRPRNASFLYGGEYPFIQTSDIKNATLYLTNYTQTYSEEGLKQSKLWDEETLCITIAANIAETTILKIKACFPDSVIGLIPHKNKATVLFVKYLFDRFKIDIQRLSQGVAQDNLNQEKLSEILFNFPTIEEQQKIADFLTKIDNKINQLSQKKQLLERYKKGVMQQIFSQSIRFADDDGREFPEWEEKTLDEILDYEQPTKYLVSSTEYSNVYKIPVLTAGKTFILGYTDETHGVYKKGLPVIIFDDFTTAFKFVTFPFKAKSSAMKILKSMGEANIKYVFEAMSTLCFSLGDEHKRYWISEYSKQYIPFPCIEEQTKIADFLTALDTKIALVESQLNGMKQYKKGLLQQLFI